jgi:hypothetical protein
MALANDEQQPWSVEEENQVDIRTLAMASMLALAVAGIPAVSAHADTKGGKTQPKLCSYSPGDDGEDYTYVVPGTVVQFGTEEHSHLEVCGKDGNWQQALVVQPGGLTGGSSGGTRLLP